MATKPSTDWPEPPPPPEPSIYERAFFRVIGACVCVIAIATTCAAVHRLVYVIADTCLKGGAA